MEPATATTTTDCSHERVGGGREGAERGRGSCWWGTHLAILLFSGVLLSVSVDAHAVNGSNNKQQHQDLQQQQQE